LTTNLEFIVIVSAIEPTIKKQKRRKWWQAYLQWSMW
jgi:hypothetical protein